MTPVRFGRDALLRVRNCVSNIHAIVARRRTEPYNEPAPTTPGIPCAICNLSSVICSATRVAQQAIEFLQPLM
jgi:hypothetical protein